MKKIVIKLQVEGIHCWPDCPIKEVSYLQNPHRHIFYIRIEREVEHNDRDIEIIEFKHLVTEYLEHLYWSFTYDCLDFKTMSCEDIAENLLETFNAQLVEVLEDNENGAIITI